MKIKHQSQLSQKRYSEALNEINLLSLGYAATHGCSRCNKLFCGTVGNKNYGGFDLS